MYRSGMGGMDRDFGHGDMPMNRGFGDSFGGMGKLDSHFREALIFTASWYNRICINLHSSLGGGFGGGMGSGGMGHMGTGLGTG